MLRIPAEENRVSNSILNRLKPPRSPRKRKFRRFIKGPISLRWMSQVAKLPGKALHVGLALCYVRGLTGKDTVKVPRKVLKEFSIGHRAWYSALKHMEREELILKVQRKGCSPEITVLFERRQSAEIVGRENQSW